MLFKIFSGSSNIEFAERMSKSFGKGLSDIEIKHFKDGEISVLIKEDVSDCDCFVVQSLCKNANDNLVEMLMISDALKRSNARKITAVIPYLGYMRQDRRCRYGEPISCKVIASVISQYFDRVITIDLHVPQIEAFFDIPVVNLSCFDIFINDIENIKGFSNEDFVVVAPDVGASKNVRRYADRIGCQMIIIEKQRKRANESQIMSIIGDVKGKNAIIIDDMIDTGGTICNVAKLLSNNGAKSIRIYASHAVCSGSAFELLSDKCINSVTFSNSIPVNYSVVPKNMSFLDVSSTIFRS